MYHMVRDRTNDSTELEQSLNMRLINMINPFEYEIIFFIIDHMVQDRTKVNGARTIFGYEVFKITLITQQSLGNL